MAPPGEEARLLPEDDGGAFVTPGPIPLLIVSDAPSSGTGLGRITKDLAVRIHERLPDVCRVATLGYGGPGSAKFEFPQYTIEGMEDFIIPAFPQIWEDFAGRESGVVMTIWDLCRLMWFVQPARCEMLSGYPELRHWLMNPPFRRWGYFPIDAGGPNDKLTFPLHQTLLGFERTLAYGPWAEKVIKHTLGEDESRSRRLDQRPHGIDTTVFYPRGRVHCRFKFGAITGARTLLARPQLGSILHNEVLVGIVATNQVRKDWALGVETAALIAKRRKLRLWIHVDKLEKYWSIPALLADYELLDTAMISLGFLPDEAMAEAYSACDLTLGIGPEGWGFPLAESQACGTPVITGSYAGGSDIVPKEMQVEPIAFRYEGLYSSKRPVFDPADWADRALRFLDERVTLDPQYAWANLWPRWEEWFREGLAA